MDTIKSEKQTEMSVTEVPSKESLSEAKFANLDRMSQSAVMDIPLNEKTPLIDCINESTYTNSNSSHH